MKKFVVILSVLISCLSAYAGDEIWNFSTWALNPGGYTANLTIIEDLRLYNMTASATYGVIDGSVKTIDGNVFTRRFKMGGAGYTTQAVPPIYRPTQRYFAVLVDGNASVSVSFTTASSGTERVCYITDGLHILGQELESANTGITLTANYVGVADTLFVFGNGAINIYQVTVTHTLTNSTQAISSSTLKKMGDIIQNPNNLQVEIYSIMGVKVMCSSESAIQLGDLPKAMYIAKTNRGSLKFIR